MSKKMSEETKAKLKAAKDAKKGRGAIHSYDPVGWQICLDRVVSGQHDPLPETIGNQVKGFIYPYNLPFYHYAVDSGDRGRVSYVAIRRITDRQLADLVRMFGDQSVRRQSYYGMGRSTIVRSNIFPAYPIVQLFSALWPKDNEWRERANMYLIGFTRDWVSSNGDLRTIPESKETTDEQTDGGTGLGGITR